MDDGRIIELYKKRSKDAIKETEKKYGGLCRRIIKNVLKNTQDEEECINDTLLGVWNAIPPAEPSILSSFVCKIARNQAQKKYEYIIAEKRNPNAVLSLTELEECVSGKDSIDKNLDSKSIETAINEYLKSLDDVKCAVFVLRYWYFEPIEVICKRSGFSISKVTSMLHQMRSKLKAHLESKGVEL